MDPMDPSSSPERETHGQIRSICFQWMVEDFLETYLTLHVNLLDTFFMEWIDGKIVQNLSNVFLINNLSLLNTALPRVFFSKPIYN